MSGEDIGNVDAVQTEAQAIQLAEAFLADSDEYRIQATIRRSKELGRDIPIAIYIYTLEKKETNTQGWILRFSRDLFGGGTVDPSFVYVSVDRKTGETKYW